MITESAVSVTGNKVKNMFEKEDNITAKEEMHKVDLNKLQILFTIVRRKKADSLKDLIQSFDSNMQLTVLARGTATAEMLSSIGMEYSDQVVIISVIRKEMERRILDAIEENFQTVKGSRGIAFTVSMTSIIGASVFSFLSNNRNMVKEELL